MIVAVVILAVLVVVLLGVIVVLWRAVNIAPDECAELATELATERADHELTLRIVGEQAVIQYDLKTERDALLAKVEHLELTRDNACVEATRQRRLAEAAGSSVDAAMAVANQTHALLVRRMVETAP